MKKATTWCLGSAERSQGVFVGGSRESICLILFKQNPKYPEQNKQLCMWTCNGHIFLLHEHKDPQFMLPGTQLSAFPSGTRQLFLRVNEFWSLWPAWRQKEESLWLLQVSLSSMASPLSLLCSWALASLNGTAPSCLGQTSALNATFAAVHQGAAL